MTVRVTDDVRWDGGLWHFFGSGELGPAPGEAGQAAPGPQFCRPRICYYCASERCVEAFGWFHAMQRAILGARAIPRTALSFVGATPLPPSKFSRWAYRAAQTAGCTTMRGGRHGICKLSRPGSGPLAARALPRRGVLLLWACHVASHAAWHCCRATKPGRFCTT